MNSGANVALVPSALNIPVTIVYSTGSAETFADAAVVAAAWFFNARKSRMALSGLVQTGSFDDAHLMKSGVVLGIKADPSGASPVSPIVADLASSPRF